MGLQRTHSKTLNVHADFSTRPPGVKPRGLSGRPQVLEKVGRGERI